MKSVLAWLASAVVTAVLGLAIASTLYGNRDDAGSGWLGGPAVMVAFMAGAVPMTLFHGAAFRYLRPGDPPVLRMARAAVIGLLAFGLVIGVLTTLAHRV